MKYTVVILFYGLYIGSSGVENDGTGGDGNNRGITSLKCFEWFDWVVWSENSREF